MPFLEHVLCTLDYIKRLLYDEKLSIIIYLHEHLSLSFTITLYSCLGTNSLDSQPCKRHVKLYSNRSRACHRMGRHNIHAQLHCSFIDHFFIVRANQGLISATHFCHLVKIFFYYIIDRLQFLRPQLITSQRTHCLKCKSLIFGSARTSQRTQCL